MEEEVWATIPDYPDYLISNHGRVKSLGRWVTKSTGAIVWFPTIILQQAMRQLYFAVNIYRDKKAKMFSVHKIVANVFVENPDPINKTHVNHKDTNKLNNSISNLEWVTPKENTHHAMANGVFGDPPQGSKNGQSKLTEQDVTFIRNTRYKVSRKELAKKFGVSIKHIDRVRCGERWGHIK